MIKTVSDMMTNIKAIPSVPGASADETKVKTNFSELLGKAIDSVNQMQNDSAKIGELFAAGKIDDLHTLMIETEKADLALQFTLQVRNKLLDAYNEIMRMQI